MNSKRIQLLLTGVAACISLLLMITTTYGASIVIGGDYTDIGTIVVISPKPGDTPQTNGTALLNNLAGISADASNRYLIKLGAGIYDIGTSSLQMKEYVDIEGSGENATIITGIPSDTDSTGCTLTGANNAGLRFVTVKNTGAISQGRVAAICNISTSPDITHVRAICSGGTAVCFGILNSISSARLTNVYANASGAASNAAIANYNSPSPGPTLSTVRAIAKITEGNYATGVLNSGGGPDSVVVLSNVTAEASGGVAYTSAVYNIAVSAVLHNVTAVSTPTGTPSPTAVFFAVFTDGFDVCPGCTVRIHNSVLKGSTGTIGEIHHEDTGHGLVTRVANSQMDGAIVLTTPARVKCAGVFDETYTFYASTCP